MKISVMIALAAMLTGLTACSGLGKDEPDKTALASSPSVETSASASASPEPVVAFTAPLTGLPVQHEVTKRPLAIMINNFSAARPQSGLTHADMVWEVLAEGGITRLVAFFQSDAFTDPVGPIRSIRPYLIDIGETYGGVLVHSGASNDALALLQHSGKADLDEINNAGAYFYRDKSRKAPHNLYSTLDKLRQGTLKHNYPETVPMPKLIFTDSPDLSQAVPATEVHLKFLLSDYKVSYAYNAASNKYLRSINGKPHIDKNNNEQLSATNLVVLSTKINTYDSYGRLEMDLTSGGEAVVFEAGKAIVCSWERAKGDAIWLMKDGQELPLQPGVTYYHVVPNTPSLESHVTYQ